MILAAAPLAQEHGKAGAGWCSSALSQLAESPGGPRKVLGASRTPGVWSQRQMDEKVDKAGENRRLLWRLKEALYSGPLECRWRTASYKEITCSRWLEAPLAHMFQGVDWPVSACAGGMRLDKGNGQGRHRGLQ